MTQRDPQVWLDPKFTRCTPQAKTCNERERCGRFLAPIPRLGSMDDFTRHWPMFMTYKCTHFMPAGRRLAAPAEPRVHPPIGGVS